MVLLLIPVFHRNESELKGKADAVNGVEPAVFEVIGLRLERDVPINVVLVADRIQQFLAACELLA